MEEEGGIKGGEGAGGGGKCTTKWERNRTVSKIT